MSSVLLVCPVDTTGTRRETSAAEDPPACWVLCSPFTGVRKEEQMGASAVRLGSWEASATATDFEDAKSSPFNSDSIKPIQLWQ